MLPRLSVNDMIGAFGATYRTIDLRSVAVKQGGIWANVYSTIRFRYEEPDVVEKRLRQLEAVHGVVRTESFQVLLDRRPFTEWNQVHGDLEVDKLRVASVEL